jgi:hypothetical protein
VGIPDRDAEQAIDCAPGYHRVGMVWLAVIIVLALGLAILVHRGDRSTALVAGGVLILTAALAYFAARDPFVAGSARDPALAQRPLEIRGRGYASSDGCQSCHPAEYATWRQSYHRTMTQVVTPETMLAEWDGTVLEVRGETYRLEQRGDQFWVDMVDLEFDPNRRFDGRPVESAHSRRRVQRRAVQSTGSHHQQIFWVSSGRGRELHLLPFTWLVRERRWVPYESTLLKQPDPFQTTEEWNTTCIPCHATAGAPRPVPFSDHLDTHVAELGIACEACHGPGEEHARRFRNPVRRFVAYAARALEMPGSETGIVNPSSLDALRSTQVCGQCHSHNRPGTKAEAESRATGGYSYRPGQNLLATRELLERPPEKDLESMRSRYLADSIFWEDGIVRTAGRDYHGVLSTPCFASSEYSCLSCHAMHGYEDRDDQLKPGMRTNQACTQCHEDLKIEERLEAHTHHPARSSGSQCYDCHMPHSNYALLKAVRTHTITSPTVTESVLHGRPNACNLCHLDQTLEWTNEALAGWYGIEAGLPDDHVWSERAAAVDWLLEGDAAQRGLIAAAMSRREAQATSGTEWMAPLLAQLLSESDYPAVRLIAETTISELPEFEDVDTQGELARNRVLERWRSIESPSKRGARVYQTDDGQLDSQALSKAYRRRDQRVVGIAE